jgi:nitrogen fixation-related uncharacterized protein
MEKKKLILPVSIILGCVIIGGFIYASQANKQESIERQQLIKIQADKEVEKTKSEMEQKKYIADRKTDCLNIYKTESDKWNNAKGWRYNETDDECLIRYKDQNPKSSEKCDEIYPINKGLGLENFLSNAMCKDGEFENSF